MTDRAYDCETYPNCYMIGFKCVETGERWRFEISTRRDDRQALYQFLSTKGWRAVGYNNIGFDYPVLHWVVMNPYCTVQDIYDYAMAVIRSSRDDKFAFSVWESEWIVPQIDLFKIHHFDNVNKATSLKLLEFNMRMQNIQDLPFPVGTVLTDDQMDTLGVYMDHDIDATELFYKYSKKAIEFRENFSQIHGKNVLNHNNGKIGREILVERIGKDKCYQYVNGEKVPIQTQRPFIRLADVVYPYIRFEQPEFDRILSYFKSQTITGTKGVFNDLRANVIGLEYVFGLGGIHASVKSQIIYSDDEYKIEDADVASFYASNAIANKRFPAHLGNDFFETFLTVFNERRDKYPKDKFPEINQVFKDALNVPYGDSNNKYSPFYDPQYTMTITINGQLMLCMLAEQLVKVPGLVMIQANTDGVTYRYPRVNEPMVRQITDWWQQFTLLTLEFADYKIMAIKDVNNYIAVTTKNKIKRKGAYCYIGAHTGRTDEMDWNQPHNSLIVAMAAEAAILLGADIRQFITSYTNWFDFMNVAKVKRSEKLTLDGEQIQSISRYYISHTGGNMKIIRPPLGSKYEWTLRDPATGKTKKVKSEKGAISNAEKGFTETVEKLELAPKERTESVCAGWRVRECNDMATFNPADLNYEWYIAEAEKLVKPLISG